MNNTTISKIYEGNEEIEVATTKIPFQTQVYSGDVYDYVKLIQLKNKEEPISNLLTLIIPYLKKKYNLKEKTIFIEDLSQLHPYSSYKVLNKINFDFEKNSFTRTVITAETDLKFKDI